ncbi:hypothetical protein JW823_04035 [bacterium]|nr:hypothetical protein [candidate division CSSED10-310 bacterium]
MSLSKHRFMIILALIITSCSISCIANTEKTTRRNIDVTYEYSKIDDGFGNIRKIVIEGNIQNSSTRIASKVVISFKCIWKNRTSDFKKLEFQNVMMGESQPFDFVFELGAQPAALQSLVCNIDQIKFSNTREASPLTPYNMVVHELYSLARLNEEGKSFQAILSYLMQKHPFRIPEKDEFETTSEHETKVNQAENEHFSLMMDELEKRYGQLLGGSNAIIRFLPRSFKKGIVYLSECSAYFQVPVQFGPYNADRSRFENITMNPRTFPFPLETQVPVADLQFLHKAGMFFLRKSEFDIDRMEAKIWRNQGKYLLLEATIRFGVVQDGPYFKDLCIIEKVILKNPESNRVFREWLINP